MGITTVSKKSRYIVISFVVLLTSAILVDNVTSTLNFYGASEVDHTLSTRVVGMTEDLVIKAGYTTTFFFLFQTEVWNSYPARQKILTSTECGLLLSVTGNFSAVYSQPEILPQDGECKTLKTEVVYDKGITKDTLLLGIRFNLVRLEEIPDGTYDFVYGGGVEVNSISKMAENYITRVQIDGGKISSLTLPDVPDNWGSLQTVTSPLPLGYDFFWAIFALPLLRRIEK